MASTTKLTATMPDGTVATRTTARRYTHVLAIHSPNKVGDPLTWGALSWHGSPQLAAKAMAAYNSRCLGYGVAPMTTMLVPVVDPTGDGPQGLKDMLRLG